MSGPRPGHIRVSDTPTVRFLLGAIKGNPRPPTLKNTRGEAPGPLGGDFLIPPWNPSILKWFHLSKDRILHFPLRFHLFQGIFDSPLDLLAPWMDLKFLKHIAL